MLNIIYRSGGIYCYEYKGKKPIFAGMVATFSANRSVKICSNKTVPAGFFTWDHPHKDYHLPPNFDKGCIAVGHGEYQTDIYEEGLYKINDFLYCSCNGKITNNKKYKGNFIIGIVNYVDEKLVGFVTCLAKGLE